VGEIIGQRVRFLLPILGLVALIAVLVAIKFMQISSLMNMGKEMAKAGPPPETVGTAVAQTQVWEGTLSAVGSITAAKGVVLSNDAPGIVPHIYFESGAVVRQGQTLVDLDTSVERAQLASSRAGARNGEDRRDSRGCDHALATHTDDDGRYRGRAFPAHARQRSGRCGP
jgi:multidrug efflux pump subunit AcrA (membrane-fusion protein)